MITAASSVATRIPVVVSACRGCGHPRVIDPGLLSFGDVPILRFDPTAGQTTPSSPLILWACTRCCLVQLSHNVPPDWLYHEYWYRSGVNEAMVAELRDVVYDAVARVPLIRGDKVVDIGANDGTLLQQYEDPGAITIGFEPAGNLADVLRGRADVVYHGYFPPVQQTYLTQVRIITSIAMLYDLPDVHAFLAGIRAALAHGGVWIAEFQDLYHLILRGGWDMICHEHLELYTLTALAQLLESHDLHIVDCQRRRINGGSVRVVIRHRANGDRPHPSVAAYMNDEAALGLTTIEGLRVAFEQLDERIIILRRQVRALLASAATRGPIDLYGASTKGHTLLHVLGIDARHIRRAIERSPEKWGRVYGTSGIPIVSEAEGREDPAPTLLSVIWQFRDAVVAREHQYLKDGGAIIFPLPFVEVVTGTNEG